MSNMSESKNTLNGISVPKTTIGQFIAELRREKMLTQKDLAAQLHVTDKAVSKWERGLSCPDISLLTSIADILDVTVAELLNGQRSSENAPGDIGKTINNALIYAEKSAERKTVSFQNVLAISFSILLLAGIIVCSICNIAISGTFTWSIYSIVSIIFAWLVFLPLIKYGSRGIFGSLLIFSILIIPFLYFLSITIGSNMIMSVGVSISLFSIVFLWCVYLIFIRLKKRKIMASAFSLLLAIPLCVAINISLTRILSTPDFNVWDMLSFAVILVSAVTLFIIDYLKSKKCCE